MGPKMQKISQLVPEKNIWGWGSTMKSIPEAQPHQNLKKSHCEHYLFHYFHFIQIEHSVLLPFPKKTNIYNVLVILDSVLTIQQNDVCKNTLLPSLPWITQSNNEANPIQ